MQLHQQPLPDCCTTGGREVLGSLFATFSKAQGESVKSIALAGISCCNSIYRATLVAHRSAVIDEVLQNQPSCPVNSKFRDVASSGCCTVIGVN